MAQGKTQKVFKCAICGLEMNSFGKGTHLKKHGLTVDTYKREYEGFKDKERKCMVCGKDISGMHPNVKICSEECQLQHKKDLLLKEIEKNNKKYEGMEDIPTCKVCGWKSFSLQQHLTQKHKMTLDEYKEKFNIMVLLFKMVPWTKKFNIQ